MWYSVSVLFIIPFLPFNIAVCPNGILANNVTLNDELTIIRIHNNFRRKILNGQVSGQPKATAMNMLVWDEKLANEAQKVADTCDFKHLIVKDRRFTNVGQNLYLESSTVKLKSRHNWEKAITAWFDEYKLFTYPVLSPKTLHYTQLIWAETEYVGCGITDYLKDDKYQRMYVCNYGPGGNIVGKVPYKTS